MVLVEPGALKQLWWRWKSLKLPWRKQWLVGFDLSGNTFWEFQDQINAGRVRRIARYTNKTHLGDVNLSPQWVQWLRHTRSAPPSINEQQLDEIRQAQMKTLAAQADARWAAKPSALDRPTRAPQSLLDTVRQGAQGGQSVELQQEMEHQAQVQSDVGNAAETLAAQTPAAASEQVQAEEGYIRGQRAADTAGTSSPAAASPATTPLQSQSPQISQSQEHQHQQQMQQQQQQDQESLFRTPPSQFKAKEFKGFKLAKEGEQAPDSWVPKAAARRRGR